MQFGLHNFSFKHKKLIHKSSLIMEFRLNNKSVVEYYALKVTTIFYRKHVSYLSIQKKLDFNFALRKLQFWHGQASMTIKKIHFWHAIVFSTFLAT